MGYVILSKLWDNSALQGELTRESDHRHQTLCSLTKFEWLKLVSLLFFESTNWSVDGNTCTMHKWYVGKSTYVGYVLCIKQIRHLLMKCNTGTNNYIIVCIRSIWGILAVNLFVVLYFGGYSLAIKISLVLKFSIEMYSDHTPSCIRI